MSELIECFVMHGIGQVSVNEKPAPSPDTIDAMTWGCPDTTLTSTDSNLSGLILDN